MYLMEYIVVDAKGLKKKVNERVIAENITFEVKRGECFGIFGPKSSGKSALIRMMYGLSTIEEGELFVLGMNLKTHSKEVKARIGIVPQEDSLEEEFSILDNLLVYASYHQISYNESLERTKYLLRMMKLEDVWGKKVDTLDRGMKRRLALARSLLNNPEVLFLDDPTAGLDSSSRLFICDLLRKFKAEEKTIVLGTQFVEEAEQICDRLAIMDRGKILTIGAPSELIQKIVGEQVLEVGLKPADIPYYSRKLAQEGYEFISMETKIYLFLKTKNQAEEILKIAPSNEYSLRAANLNDVFLRLVGYEIKD